MRSQVNSIRYVRGRMNRANRNYLDKFVPIHGKNEYIDKGEINISSSSSYELGVSEMHLDRSANGMPENEYTKSDLHAMEDRLREQDRRAEERSARMEERIDRRSIEMESRIEQRMQDTVLHSNAVEERIEKRHVEILGEIRSMRSEMRDDIREARTESKSARNWIIGLCLAIILGMAAIVVTAIIK